MFSKVSPNLYSELQVHVRSANIEIYFGNWALGIGKIELGYNFSEPQISVYLAERRASCFRMKRLGTRIRDCGCHMIQPNFVGRMFHWRWIYSPRKGSETNLSSCSHLGAILLSDFTFWSSWCFKRLGECLNTLFSLYSLDLNDRVIKCKFEFRLWFEH